MHGRRMSVLADAHVHLHDCADPAVLLEAAARNFRTHAPRERWTGALLLAETAGRSWFDEVRRANGAVAGPWRVERGSDEDTLVAACGRARLAIVAGCQGVAAERVEVLALLTRERIPDGLTLDATIAAALGSGGIAVLPWGVGKWLGARGRRVIAALESWAGQPVYAGDNASRPWPWPEPAAFEVARRAGRAVLPGTDPLPLRGAERRVGSYGVRIEAIAATATVLRALLAGGAPPALHAFGGPDAPWRVLGEQLRLRAAQGRAA
ncbi:MAG: hypothetical protein ACK52I_27350 [Pseudomonadota bacterium]